MSLSPEALAETVAALAADKKAADIVTLDLRGVAGYLNFFVVCSGNTDRQTRPSTTGSTWASSASTGCCRAGSRASAKARWVLLGLPRRGRPRLHATRREFYRLEHLWGDVPRRVHDEADGRRPAAAGG